MAVPRQYKGCLCGTLGSCPFHLSDSGTVMQKTEQWQEGEGCKLESSWVLVLGTQHTQPNRLKTGSSESLLGLWFKLMRCGPVLIPRTFVLGSLVLCNILLL